MRERLSTVDVDIAKVTVTKTLIFDGAGKMLALRRSPSLRPDRPDHRGKLSLPGGEVNLAEESIDGGAIREIREETGLDLTPDDLQSCYGERRVVRRDFVPLRIEWFGYIALMPPGQTIRLDPDEHDAEYWLTTDEFLAKTDHPGHHRFIAHVREVGIAPELWGIDIASAAML